MGRAQWGDGCTDQRVPDGVAASADGAWLAVSSLANSPPPCRLAASVFCRRSPPPSPVVDAGPSVCALLAWLAACCPSTSLTPSPPSLLLLPAFAVVCPVHAAPSPSLSHTLHCTTRQDDKTTGAVRHSLPAQPSPAPSPLALPLPLPLRTLQLSVVLYTHTRTPGPAATHASLAWPARTVGNGKRGGGEREREKRARHRAAARAERSGGERSRGGKKE